ncbi:hypothetical protein [Thalassiella azotivora]
MALRRAGRLMTRFAVLVLAAVVTSTLRLPWQAAALVFSVGAVVVGVLATRAVVRARMGGAGVAFAAAGVGLSAVMVVVNGASVALWPVQAELQRCQQRAVTEAAERRCLAEYERTLTDLVPGPATP